MFVKFSPPKFFLFFIFASTIMACSEKETPRSEQLPPAQSHSAVRRTSSIVVPDDVRRNWKAVKIAVVNKKEMYEKVYLVPIGGKIDASESGLRIEVEAFLPAFVMEGAVMTSSSSKLANPAAKVKITEKETMLFNGWLFSRFPNAHAFMSPNYGFTLVEIIPAK